MSAVVFDRDDHPPGLPDDLKVPERHVHRQAVDVIALAATRLLGPSVRVFRDMNWYPVVLRLGPDDLEVVPRTGRPLPELGDLILDFDDRQLVVELPDGLRSRSDADLLSTLEARAEESEARAIEANARAAELARLLREQGIDPDLPG